MDNCTWTWDQINGVHGWSVSGNNNSIFLPTAGFRHDTDLNNVGSDCNYWSSSLVVGDEYMARFFYSEGSTSSDFVHSYYRYEGHSIRPVIDIPSNEPNALYKPIELVIGGSGNEPTPITWNRQTEKYEAHLSGSFTGSDIDIYMNELMSSYEDMRSVEFSNLNGIVINEQQVVNNFFNQGRLLIGAGVVSSPDAGEKSFDTTVTFRDGSSWTLTISWTQEAVD